MDCWSPEWKLEARLEVIAQPYERPPANYFPSISLRPEPEAAWGGGYGDGEKWGD